MFIEVSIYKLLYDYVFFYSYVSMGPFNNYVMPRGGGGDEMRYETLWRGVLEVSVM